MGLAIATVAMYGCRVAAQAAAEGPRFLDRSALDIPLRRLAADPTHPADRTAPAPSWAVEALNPSGQTIEVRLRVAGPIADAIQVADPASMRIPPGQSGVFRLTRGTRPHAGSGELVVVSVAGLDRRPVLVTQPTRGGWAGLRDRVVSRWPLAVGLVAILLILLVYGRAQWGRRRRSVPKTGPPTLPAAPGAAGAAADEASLDTRIWHNDESTIDDRLDRGHYVTALAKLARTVEPPMVIGLFGEWGSGKTTLLRHLHAELDAKTSECAVVWFDAWKHQFDENPVLPLLHAVVRDLGLEGHGEVRRALWVITEAFSSIALSATTRLTVGDVRKSIDAYDEANFRLRSTRTRLDEHFAELVTKALLARGARRLIIFIDDLDRCLPDQIIALLEALKLYLNRRDCVFLLAVDNERLVKVIAGKYGELGIEGTDYLEKIVQMPFLMPRLSRPVFARYVDHLLPQEIEAAAPLLRVALKRNPRAIKRFVNVLVLHDAVARARGVSPYDVRVLATVLLLRTNVPEFYRTLEADPTRLRRVADDVDAAEEGETPMWADEVVAVVERLRRATGVVPRDVTGYLDLATASAPSEDQRRPTHLDETIASKRETAEAAVGDPVLLAELAEALLARFRRTGVRTDLEEAIGFFRSGVSGLPATDRSRSARLLSGLGDALRTSFELSGDTSDLDEAITYKREAVEATPAAHPAYATRLTSLALALRHRFGVTRRRPDLDAAIDVGRQAVDAAPEGHPDRPAIVSDLRRALHTRFELDRRQEDLDEADRLGRLIEP
ncbi:MAG TPA: P-loop NTPase fold protein [Streptosporangiaceae bacterium]|nr:P-loop NTPase fold protein [Streptosporangiaceae bacterium]